MREYNNINTFILNTFIIRGEIQIFKLMYYVIFLSQKLLKNIIHVITKKIYFMFISTQNIF